MIAVSPRSYKSRSSIVSQLSIMIVAFKHLGPEKCSLSIYISPVLDFCHQHPFHFHIPLQAFSHWLHKIAMAWLINILDVITLTFAGLLIIQLLYGRNTNTPLPPGPKGWPLLGNLLEIPTTKEWLAFAALGKKWGKIPLARPFTVLTTIQVIWYLSLSLVSE